MRGRVCCERLGLLFHRLNGAAVADRVLDPGWTNYGKRVLYSSYDVTAADRPGLNCVGVMVGNGWYNPVAGENVGVSAISAKHLPVGRPRTIARLDGKFTDGTRRIGGQGRDVAKSPPGPDASV